jgi:translation initiation factor 3 subunit A
LTLLHELIVSKRARLTPLPILQDITSKFIELSVLLGKGKIAREGLNQFKNISLQNGSITAIGKAIKQFIDLSKNKLLSAQDEAKQINLAQIVDDLEALETPEMIMLSTISEDSKERTDRHVVTPWLRFLWESYRTALETLRNHSGLESYYQVL